MGLGRQATWRGDHEDRATQARPCARGPTPRATGSDPAQRLRRHAGLRVLADAVKELHLTGALSVPWRVVLTFSEADNSDTTFSLEPDLDDRRPLLPALRRDIDAIAEHLRESAFIEARKLSRMAG
ncbi:MAG: hypothetical protein V3U23_09520 [Kiloniellales bacterium]